MHLIPPSAYAYAHLTKARLGLGSAVRQTAAVKSRARARFQSRARAMGKVYVAMLGTRVRSRAVAGPSSNDPAR